MNAFESNWLISRRDDVKFISEDYMKKGKTRELRNKFWGAFSTTRFSFYLLQFDYLSGIFLVRLSEEYIYMSLLYISVHRRRVPRQLGDKRL